MTVKELHTFTDADMDTITDALKIANAHYRALSELSSTRYGTANFREMFEQQARDAADLQLKIEAGR